MFSRICSKEFLPFLRIKGWVFDSGFSLFRFIVFVCEGSLGETGARISGLK